MSHIIPRKSRCGVILVLITLVNIIIFSVISFDDQRSIVDNFDMLKAQNLLQNLKSKEKPFDQLVDVILKNKKAENSEKYWITDTKVTATGIDIPDHLLPSKSEELRKSTFFDPRLTFSLYLNQLYQIESMKKDSSGIYFKFHWADWVDLSVLNHHLTLPEDLKPSCKLLDISSSSESKNRKEDIVKVENYCIDNDQIPQDLADGNTYRPGFNVFQHSGRSTKELRALEAKSYLYSFAPPPFSIIFLVGNASVSIKTDQATKQKISDSDFIKEYMKSKKNSKKVDPLKELKALQKVKKFEPTQFINNYEVNIPQESFINNYQRIIDSYDSVDLNTLSMQELNYLNSLKYSVDRVEKGAPKYFYEAKLLKSQNNYGLGAHYDWRFFSGIINFTHEQTIVLHRLFRVWLSFTRNHGIVTWIAHGSLLGWYWDGLSFPWDTDIDVQMPLHDLHELSKRFNQSLIIEDLEDGFGRYFLDCGSFITQRSKGNGNNNIDARFIDVDTGLYIDITGLALTDTTVPERYLSKEEVKEEEKVKRSSKQVSPPPVKSEEEILAEKTQIYHKNTELQAYNCRNNHFVTHQELSPLKLSLIEGAPAYVPKNYEEILKVEYTRGLTAKKFKGYTYIPQIRLWVLTRYIQQYIRTNSRGKRVIKDFDDEDILNILTSYDEILCEYYLSRGITQLHQDEMQLFIDDVSSEALVNGARFSPMRHDLFMYKERTMAQASKEMVKDEENVVETETVSDGIQFRPATTSGETMIIDIPADLPKKQNLKESSGSLPKLKDRPNSKDESTPEVAAEVTRNKAEPKEEGSEKDLQSESVSGSVKEDMIPEEAEKVKDGGDADEVNALTKPAIYQESKDDTRDKAAIPNEQTKHYLSDATMTRPLENLDRLDEKLTT